MGYVGSTGPRLAVEGLGKSFGAIRAVDELSFSVRPGAVTGFLGPNGAGKTTTLRMLLGLTRPSAGRALVGDRPYAAHPVPARVVGAAIESSGFHPGRTGLGHLGVRALVLGVVVTVLWTMIGVAFGSVVPNQVAAVVVILAFTQFEPIARLALGSFDGTDAVAKFLPGAAADGLIGASLFGELGGGSADLLSRPAALAVLVGYAAGLALAGRLTTLRRDIA